VRGGGGFRFGVGGVVWDRGRASRRTFRRGWWLGVPARRRLLRDPSALGDGAGVGAGGLGPTPVGPAVVRGRGPACHSPAPRVGGRGRCGLWCGGGGAASARLPRKGVGAGIARSAGAGRLGRRVGARGLVGGSGPVIRPSGLEAGMWGSRAAAGLGRDAGGGVGVENSRRAGLRRRRCGRQAGGVGVVLCVGVAQGGSRLWHPLDLMPPACHRPRGGGRGW